MEVVKEKNLSEEQVDPEFLSVVSQCGVIQ